MIRPYAHTDAAALSELAATIVRAGDAYVFTQADELTSYLLLDECFVAVREGELLGAYGLHANQPGRGSHIANAGYVVAASARGQGIGRTLAEHSIARARELGFTAMQFNLVVKTNAAAVALWEKLGFRIVGTIPAAFLHPSGDYVDGHVMYRDLSDGS